ncbi:hypothetical protein D3C86_1764220 [compost metagenome]
MNFSILPAAALNLSDSTESCQLFRPMSCRNSWRVLLDSRKAPSITEVLITEFCFSTPRIIMHMCFASITTATPAASVTREIASAICRVRFS